MKDAQLALDNGASAIGLIFYKPSPRNVSLEMAIEIIRFVNGCIPIVGVFVDEDIQLLKSILSQVNIDIIQLHGKESPQYCEQFNLPIIKVFRVGPGFDESVLTDYNVSAFLFDTYKKGLPGGTGEQFEWELISDLKCNSSIILSGGLTSQNILNGMKIVNPSAVDVNSGVENCPGEKSEEKVLELFREVGVISKRENIFHEIKDGISNV
ncbi:MAG: phosphoribosylanthranilate isomerase [Candidatus Marinimicrobia bacterium]|nr:phosphoribosylanthranilate isomerase [Candidatus Neomarinimicrobiota bacterium]